MTSFSFATLFLASLVGTALGAPGAYQPKLRVPSRELHVDEQQQQQERELTYVPPTTDPDLCAQAEGIKADIASNNVELAETKSQIAATKVHLAGLEANLENARKDQKLKTRYLKHLTEFPDMEAGIASLEAIEAKLLAALEVYEASEQAVNDSLAVMDEKSYFATVLSTNVSPLLLAASTANFDSKKTLLKSAMMTTCAELDTAEQDCADAAAGLAEAATALEETSDTLFTTAIGLGDGTRRLQGKEVSFGANRRSLEVNEDHLDKALRAASQDFAAASISIESAFTLLETCGTVAEAQNTILDGLMSDLDAAQDDLDGNFVLDEVEAAIQAALVAAGNLHASYYSELEGVGSILAEAEDDINRTEAEIDPAADPKEYEGALVMLQRCIEEEKAKCEAYVSLLETTLEDTLALASNLEELQDDLHSSMQAQFTAMQALFATQTELTADSQEMEECSDKLVNDIAMVTDDNYVPITRN